jgi:hypothetical protein
MWKFIFNTIKTSDFDIIYMAIGCSMEYYNEVTTNNNQQYPIFLDNFNKKVILLIDPLLETPLKIETFLQNKNQTLNQITSNYDNLRYYYSDNITILGINELFIYS